MFRHIFSIFLQNPDRRLVNPSYASLLLQAGEHPKVVQELLGHATISMTLDTYSHVMPGLKEKAVGKLELLGGR